MSTTEYSDVFEEQRRALATKLPSETGYARSLITIPLVRRLKYQKNSKNNS